MKEAPTDIDSFSYLHWEINSEVDWRSSISFIDPIYVGVAIPDDVDDEFDDAASIAYIYQELGAD